MPRIALQGIRGATGTTTITAALGWALASLNETVLIIDFSTTNLLRLYFNMPYENPRGWAHAICNNRPWQQSAMRYLPSLDFLPFGHISPLEQISLEKEFLTKPHLWRDYCEELQALKNYQWILFDLPSDNLILANQGLMAANDTILVLNADSNCHVRLHQQPLPKACHLLLNKYNPSHLLRQDIYFIWQKMLPQLLPTIIHEDESMAESLAVKKPVGEYYPHSMAAKELFNLAGWCLLNLKKTTHE